MTNLFLAAFSDFSALWGLAGVLGGGSVVKLIEYFITRGKIQVDEGAAIRVELRGEIKALIQEKDTIENVLDEWKEKYWGEHEKLIKMSARLAFLISKLEECENTVPDDLLKTFKGFVSDYYGITTEAAEKMIRGDSAVPAVKVIEQTIKEVEK